MVIPCDAMTLIIEGSLNEKRVRKVAKLNNYLLLVSSIRNLGFCLKYLFVSSKILDMNPSIRSISA